MEPREWYGARSIYEVVDRGSEENGTKLYEERVVLIKASSFEEAIAEAEKEAFKYAHEDSGFVYLGYVDVYKSFETRIKNKMEMYSLMRESALPPKEYIDKFFDTGLERVQRSISE